MKHKIKYGMVGGSLDSFIGVVHREAIAFENTQLVAGCFSTNMQKNTDCGARYGLESDRIYASFQEMAKQEGGRADKIDFVSIVAPNNVHFEAAKAFLTEGIHVFCEKPLCFTVEQAEELEKLAEEKQLLFGVGYSYSGYTMLKEARARIQNGEIGEIINVNAEFLQEWLVDDVAEGDDAMTKLSMWRKDPEVAGISNCIGDIGTHIEHTVSYITGLHVKRLAAKLDYFGQPLDLNANVLVEFENGAHGVFCASQVCVGHMNGLTVRIFGSLGAIEWQQETPDVLYLTHKGKPTQIYHRGMGYVTPHTTMLNRLPSGHPEGLHIGAANVYRSFIRTLLNKCYGEPAEGFENDFPTAADGVSGVRFIHACVESSANDAAWTEL